MFVARRIFSASLRPKNYVYLNIKTTTSDKQIIIGALEAQTPVIYSLIFFFKFICGGWLKGRNLWSHVEVQDADC